MSIWGKKREDEKPPPPVAQSPAPIPGVDPSVEIEVDDDDPPSAASAKPRLSARQDSVTFIGDGMEIKGSVSTASGLVVAGFIEGDINSGGHVDIWPDASVEGSVSAQSVNVNGQIKGNVTVAGRLHINEKGKVHGDVEVKSLQVEEGGALLGRCKMI